ncbi:MAG: hypothetical protein OXN17_05400 [Candidatus Poribacteria bacterium]|nr:hypothetical protein [Candidatus Poribacteria bacterium]MDE0503905.1 hypothetical protein [Candidatus Poribacteria bacterium]
MRNLDQFYPNPVNWRTIRVLFFLLFITSFVPCLASFAQVEEIAIGNTFGVGARAMGMGGAFLGTADDLTALYWNPAGLAQIRKFELYGSLSHNDINSETQFTGARLIGASRSKTRPSSAGIVYPIDARRGGFAIGLGYNRPQSFDSRVVIQGIDLSDDTTFGGLDVDETNSDRGGIGIWSFGAGVFISQNIILGASMDIWHGTYVNELDSIATDVSNIDAELDNFAFHDTIDREYFGLGGRIGLLAYVTENVALGLTAVAPMDIEVDEVWREETDVVFDDGESERESDQGSILFDIERPFELGAGIAVKLLQNSLTLASDVQFTDWTQTQYSTQPTDDVSRDNFERFYDKTIQIRIGAEYQFRKFDAYTRVGYMYDPIPFNAKTIDDNRDFWTFGIGKVFDEVVKFDIAYMRGSWKQSVESLSTSQTSNRLFVSAAYRY